MTGFERHARWVWPAALLVGLLLIVFVRFLPRDPLPRGSANSGGVIAGELDDLAATVRRIRLVQGQVGQIREELAGLQAEAAARRERIALLDEMLARNALTESPGFLREETTVRALQKIIREADSSPHAAPGAEDRLHTAAGVARERLRARLQILRDQLQAEVADMDAQVEALRLRTRAQSEDVEYLQRQVQQELNSRRPATEPSR